MQLTATELDRVLNRLALISEQQNAIRHTLCEHFGIDPNSDSDEADLIVQAIYSSTAENRFQLKRMAAEEQQKSVPDQVDDLLCVAANSRDRIDRNPKDALAAQALKDSANQLTILTAEFVGAVPGSELWQEVEKEVNFVIYDGVLYRQSLRLLLQWKAEKTS